MSSTPSGAGSSPTKTDDPRRITITAPLAQVFTDQKHWLLRTQHPGLASGLVFPARLRNAKASATVRGVDDLSWYRSPSIMDRPLTVVASEAGVPPISAQSFRRTMENFERAAGIEPLVRRAMQGWRTERAQSIYAEVERSERDKAAEAVVRLVMGAAA